MDSLTTEIHKFIPLVSLYAELHYKYRFLGSRYYINEPEILADTPFRVEPSLDIPILLLIKDAHLYPIFLEYVSVNIYQSEKKIISFQTSFKEKINNRWWSQTIYIENNIYGNILLEVYFHYSINGIKKYCKTHNYPQSKNHHLESYISLYHYPKDGIVQYGDLHYHTNLTEDMVEYGAPLRDTLIAAQYMGLDFYCTTDHSYDLDDKCNSWIETDPKLKKWYSSRREIDNINNEEMFSSFIIPSEELTLHNHKGQNIHALILNNYKFLSGCGDGFEKYFNFHSEFDTKSIHNNLEENAICIAAHPFEQVSILQKLLLKRGIWNHKDIINNKLSGLQIVNGEMGPIFINGIKKWTKLLLSGFIKYIYAGNDAHGNFNIYRQIRLPMISLMEVKKQIFGKYRTGVYAKNKNDIHSIILALKAGNCFITNGPLLNVTSNSSNNYYKMGDRISSNEGTININVISSPEFGYIKDITLIKGIIGEKNEEQIVILKNLNKYEFKYSYDAYIHSTCYYRCEVNIDSNKENICAISNPIWFAPN